MMGINKLLTTESSEKKVEKYCSPDFEVMDVLFDQQILSGSDDSSDLLGFDGEEW